MKCDGCTELTKNGCGQFHFYTMEAARAVCSGPFTAEFTTDDLRRQQKARMDQISRHLSTKK